VSAADDFAALAERVVDALLALDPVGATWLGDHRFDGLLPDRSPTGVATALETIDESVTGLDSIDDLALDSIDDLVDLEILRAELLRWRFELAEVRRHTWDPMVWNPGTALYLLVARDTVPVDERAASARRRLQAVPELLATARDVLDDMPHIHVETALGQLAGTRALFDGPVRELAATDTVVDLAVAAVDEFRGWLEERLPISVRDPRLGARLYAGVLWHSLDDDVTADELLRDAYDSLDLLNIQMAETARAYLGADAPSEGLVRAALDQIATSAPVSDVTVLPLMVDALARTTAFVAERQIVTVPELDVRVIEMPEIHRGTAVAYCDAPGPLETAAVPTFVAVAPTPADWTAERVASFYREYNGVQLHDLTVHEAMPGHVLQLARSRECLRPTRVRAAAMSGPFVEGWAVYVEGVLARAGYAADDDPRSALAFALQQQKMAVRGVINTILDIGVHVDGMTEADAMALMIERGFQEEGEAAGKWRRALLTAGQLPTYFAGYRAVASIAEDLRVLHPDWTDAQVHDLMLAHGSPAPRHLRTLLGL
jgi:uncharacterized protein (DUF885 family)